jgi:hypothetical protein
VQAKHRGPATTADDRQFWAEHGHLTIEELVDPAEVRVVRDVLDDLFRRFDDLSSRSTHLVRLPDGQPGSLEVTLTTELEPTLRSTKLFKACEAVASELLGSPAKFFFDHTIRKPAGIGTGTAWHQDRAYNLVEPQRERVHFWVPMADVDADGGCMQFVPCSNHWGLIDHQPIADDPAKHTLEAVGDHDAEAVAVPLRLGGASMHGQLTMHKTGPNRSDVERTAWILQFVRPRTMGEHLTAATRRFRPTGPARL